MKNSKSRLIGLLCACFGTSVAAMHSVSADPPTAQGYVPVMADEFNGTSLNTGVWGYNYPWGHTHNGRAAMEASQVKLGSGYLDLQAIWQRDPNSWGYTNNTGGYWDTIKNQWENLDFTSGTIYSKLRWKYGYIEGRFLIPSQTSAWPAFWMLQDGWPPELDIFEFHGNQASENYTYHYTNSSANASWGGVKSGLSAGWHVFGMDWASDHLTYYVDGASVGTFTTATAIAQMGPMYILIDHQIAGWAPDPVSGDGQYFDANGGVITSHFEADYVRVWQKAPVSVADGTYRITPLNQPSMALEVKSTDPNAPSATPVDIAPATYAANQKWTLTKQTDGTFILGAFAGTASTLKLDDSGGGTTNGDVVSTRTFTGGSHQRWYILASDGGYRIIPTTEPGKTVEVTGGPSAGSGATTELWDYSTASNQLWSLDSATTPALTLSAIGATPVTDTQATIIWTTSNTASTAIDYGLTTAYGTTLTGTSGVTSHSVAVSGLKASTVYHYRVRSTDTYSQSQTSADMTLTTSGAPMPNLAVAKPTLARDTTTGDVLVTVVISNIGTGVVSNVLLSSATLGTAAATTALPVNLGSIAAGGSATTTLRFASQTAGMAAIVRLSGSGTGGATPLNFGGSRRVQVP